MKAEVRRKAHIAAGDEVTVELELLYRERVARAVPVDCPCKANVRSNLQRR